MHVIFTSQMIELRGGKNATFLIRIFIGTLPLLRNERENTFSDPNLRKS